MNIIKKTLPKRRTIFEYVYAYVNIMIQCLNASVALVGVCMIYFMCYGLPEGGVNSLQKPLFIASGCFAFFTSAFRTLFSGKKRLLFELLVSGSYSAFIIYFGIKEDFPYAALNINVALALGLILLCAYVILKLVFGMTTLKTDR